MELEEEKKAKNLNNNFEKTQKNPQKTQQKIIEVQNLHK